MIPLVDVVFFLLAFFMLVARLDATAPFEVLPPVAIGGADMPGGGVTLSVAADGTLALNGAPVPEPWLPELRRRLDGGAEPLIRVNAHRDVALRHVLPLISALEDAALGEIVLVVTPPEAR
ncbi:ExbD/TolR family protein [Jannaschia seohaensis]|uniref:ExbD/TolR family protein n=1 Tax=Jannaschia seohaensis TaxID=475081 RepID=UPI001FE73E24|nr:biopolymer transporter ExbD [Jannaschia seohaensis]